MATAGEAPSPKPGRKIHGLDASERESQRREQILESALTTFAEQGYAHTSVEQVCARANVSTKSFYRIFDNREALYLALYGLLQDQAFAVVRAAVERVARGEADEEALVRDFIDENFTDQRKALVNHGPARAVTPATERARRDVKREAAILLEETWQRLGLEGDHSGLAVAVVGGLQDLITTSLAEGKPLDEPEVDQLRAEATRFYRAVRAGLAAAGERQPVDADGHFGTSARLNCNKSPFRT